ncbi:hypothetical protein X801_04398, partial [Opisthorchis viverrini]
MVIILYLMQFDSFLYLSTLKLGLRHMMNLFGPDGRTVSIREKVFPVKLLLLVLVLVQAEEFTWAYEFVQNVLFDEEKLVEEIPREDGI